MLLATGLSQPAEGAGAKALRNLDRAPCPPNYRPGGFAADFSEAAIDDALQNDRYQLAGPGKVRLVPPIDWDQEPPDGQQRQSFRRQLVGLNWTRVLFAAYVEADNEGERLLALRKARDIFLDFIAQNPRGGKTTAPETWGTKRAGDRLALLSYLVRIATCKHLLTRGQKRMMLDSSLAHVKYIKQHRAPNNHGLFDAYGLVVAAEHLGFLEDAPEWRRLGTTRFKSILRNRMFAKEALWLDHSTTYGFAVVNLVTRFLDIPNSGERKLKVLLRRMRDAAAWLVLPDGRRLQWGDSNNAPAPDLYVRKAQEDHGFSLKRRSGLGFVRHGSGYLALLASYFSHTHKHSDDLSFELFDRGRQIVSDTGDFERDTGAIREFELSPRAHSTLTVDDQDFDRSKEGAYGSGLLAAGMGDGWYAVHGRNPLLGRIGVDHRRWVVYKPHESLIVVDRLRSATPHEYTRYFQFGPDLSLGTPLLGAADLTGSGSFDGGFFEESTTPTTIDRARGQKTPTLAGWTYPDYGHEIPRWTAEVSAPATASGDADLVAAISLTPTDLRGRLATSPGSKVVDLALENQSGPAGSLRIARDEARLAVDYRP